MRPLIIVLLTVTVLRFISFSSLPAGLYWDEMDTGYQAYSLLHTGRDYFGRLLPAHVQSLADFRSSLYMYMSVPWVALLGLSVYSVRLTAVISSLLTLPVLYLLSRKLLGMPRHLAWITPAVWGLSPWNMIQGRIAAESGLLPLFFLLGLASFYRWLDTGRYLKLTALFFALSLWTYGTAKLFLPLWLVSLAVIYRKQIRTRLSFSALLPALAIFVLVAFPVVRETLTDQVGRRYSELSVFTDPTTATAVDYRRLEAALSRGETRNLGMQPGLIDRLLINKYGFWLEKFITNYLQPFSTEFLFTRGDPQLRHHVPAPFTGQFYALEALVLIIGAVGIYSSSLSIRKKQVILIWLLLAPLPAAVTRDGGSHAPRLLLLLPPLVFLISAGVSKMISGGIGRVVYPVLYLLSLITTGYYFLTTYRTVSAPSFHSGYLPAVNYAVAESDRYDSVVLDGHNESFLMAYLFTVHPDPRTFQSSFPLPSAGLAAGVEGYVFGKFHILYPGTRNWNHLRIKPNSLVIAAATQPESDKISPTRIFSHPDGSAALVAFSP